MAAPVQNPPLTLLPIATPLPPGWTEHLAPGGQRYYYNTFTQESTYIRPLPTFVPQPHVPPSTADTSKKKKEKPKEKTPIPGTDWLRVKTTEGNVFYTNKSKKESVWVVPEEIKEKVEALELQEKEDEQRRLEEQRMAEEARLQEEEAERMRRAEEKALKRKAMAEPEPLDEVEVVVSKKARVEDETEDEGSDDEEEEEEEWQREAAAQLAAEAEEFEKQKAAEEEAAKRMEEEEKEEIKRKEKEKGSSTLELKMPSKVDLSLDEAKALFKTLLREKDVNPLHPWDTSLPLFISDPRYVLLPSVSARKDAFDEYCRDRAREIRAAKVKGQAGDNNTEVQVDPKEEFERLLKDEVKSTRTSWNEFRRTWKKDRRFYGWGRDEREREKKFKEWLVELGEQKRKAAQKAERDFFALLKEKGNVQGTSEWKDVKKHLYKDPRYDAVGSSSLREELFGTYIKTVRARNGHSTRSPERADSQTEKQTNEDDATTAERKRQEKRERAIREREEGVRAKQRRLEVQVERAKQELSKEEVEAQFEQIMTDNIREPTATWENSLSLLKGDARFTDSPLPLNQQIHLFNARVQKLRSHETVGLHTLFASHAPSLATSFSSLPLSSLLISLPAKRLGLDEENLKDEFMKWQRIRTTEARKAFDEMLGENSFVEFWGRLGKIGGEGVDGGIEGGIALDDLGETEVNAEGTKVDMKALAKNVDIKEMERVLKNDKRYVMFDHIPEERERWLRDYLGNLSAPKLSVHVGA